MGALAETQAQAPVDPSQVDTTSAAAVADPNVSGTAVSAQGGVNVARQSADSTPAAAGGEEEASPEEQGNYDKAMQAAQRVLYENDKTSDAISGMIQPDDKINSTVQASLMTISEIDKKMDLDEGIIAQVAMDVTDMIVDLGEEGRGIPYSEEETKAVWGSVWEGVMNMYGVDEEEYADYTAGMSEQDVAAQEQQYKQDLGE